MSIDAAAKAAYAELEQVLLERHEKYGPRNVSDSPGGALNGLRVRMHDKLARLNNFVDNGVTADFADDKLRDSFVDLANYAVIGLLVLDGNWPTAVSAEARPKHPSYRTGDESGYTYTWNWDEHWGTYRWTNDRTGDVAPRASTFTTREEIEEHNGPATEVSE